MYKADLLERLDHGFDGIHPPVNVVVIGIFFFELSEEVLVDEVEILPMQQSLGNCLDIRRADT